MRKYVKLQTNFKSIDMSVNDIISVIGLVGIGGLLKSTLDFFIDNRKRKSETKHEFKQTRYKAIILQCYSLIYYDKEKNNLLNHRPDLKTKDDLYNEIYTEWINMTLYASDKVITSMKKFLEHPIQETFNMLILEMRKDLYSIRTRLKCDNLIIKQK